LRNQGSDLDRSIPWPHDIPPPGNVPKQTKPKEGARAGGGINCSAVDCRVTSSLHVGPAARRAHASVTQSPAARRTPPPPLRLHHLPSSSFPTPRVPPPTRANRSKQRKFHGLLPRMSFDPTAVSFSDPSSIAQLGGIKQGSPCFGGIEASPWFSWAGALLDSRLGMQQLLNYLGTARLRWLG